MIGLMMLAAAVSGPDPRCAARVDFYQPPRGAISTPHMAAQIAEIYLAAVYGSDVIRKELPLDVEIEREVWIVRGTHRKVRPWETFIGGLAEIEMCQSTGQVLRIVHYK